MCVSDSKNLCFHKIRFWGAKPPKIEFVLTLSLILESFWEPSLLTCSLLVAPVAKIVDIF